MLRDFNEYSILNGHAKVQLSHFGWKDCETSLPTWNKCKEVRGNRMGDTVFFLHPNKWRNGDALSPLLSLTFTKRIQWKTTPPLPAIGRRAEQRDRTHRMSLQLPYWWAHSPQHSRDHTFCGLMDDIGSAVFLEGVASVGYHSFREYWELKSVQSRIQSLPSEPKRLDTAGNWNQWQSQTPLNHWDAHSQTANSPQSKSPDQLSPSRGIYSPNAITWKWSMSQRIRLCFRWWSSDEQRNDKDHLLQPLKAGLLDPHTVKVIGADAFYVCYRLTSITIPDSVKEIGDRVFKPCFELRSIRIPESVKEIGTKRFSHCWNLGKITLSGSVEIFRCQSFFRVLQIVQNHHQC